ncbi:MAG: IS21 family transposase [Bryobacteraceae bacterium]|nr:IS21 family transposase [Bryobacteraceae bacterium]
MRKIREVLRLHSLGLKQRQIARACAIGQSTVCDYIRLAEKAALTWAEVADWNESQLIARLAPVPTPAAESDGGRLPQPDYAGIHAELRKHKHLTLQLVWEEYRMQHPEGYRYSRFCELYQRWRKKQEVVLRQEHRPGEKLFVDYAGTTIPIQDPATGEVRQAQLFVAVLGASNYTFADVTWTQNLPDWIGSHLRAFEFFGGLPEIVVPDNLKSGVTRSCRYEPGVNITYEEMAGHYGVAVVPARPYKPRDKAKVEVGVQIAGPWILAALRKQTFFSLGEASRAVAPLLTRLNERAFRKREGSRKSLFELLERPVVRPLPFERFQYGDWKTARVNIDYHVEFDRHWYSVPYELTQQQVEIRATDTTVEVFHKGIRVASHPRSHIQHKHTTIGEHRPKAHQRHMEWTPSRIAEWASTTGPSTAKVVEQIMATNRHPEQGYRSCLGIIRLGKKYGCQRVETAATRAVLLNACSYRSIRSMLESGLDLQDAPELEPPPATEPIHHDNVRGAGYYGTLQ